MNRTTLRCLTLSVLAGSLGFAGCEKSSPPEAKPQPATSAAPAAALDLSDDDVPVPEDYVEEATKEIDDANYKAQLDSLDKEIQTATD